MKLSGYIHQSSKDNMLVLSVVSRDGAMGIRGTSEDSLSVGQSPISEAHIRLKDVDGGPGVVALSLKVMRGKSSDWHQILVPLDWDTDHQAVALLDEPFFPAQGQLQYSQSGLRLEYDGVVYTDSEYDATKNSHVHIPDPNLLCRFAIGRATVDDLNAKKVELAREKTELEQLREELKEVSRDRDAWRDKHYVVEQDRINAERQSNLRGEKLLEAGNAAIELANSMGEGFLQRLFTPNKVSKNLLNLTKLLGIERES